MYDIKDTLSANTIEDVLTILSVRKDVTVVAGGTDVLIRMRERKLKEAVLLGILNVGELNGIEMDSSQSIIIKAGTSFTDIANHPLIRQWVPVLAYAATQVGSPQIRNIATMGGNLCNGAVSADSVPALLVLDAVLELRSKTGKRIVPVAKFHTDPGKTVLNQDELLTKIIIPREGYERWAACYRKAGQRRAMEISTLGCAVNVLLKQNKHTIEMVRIGFGVAAPVPVRCYKLERKLQGMETDRHLLELFRQEVLEELSPRDSWRASKELRIQLIKELGCRALKQAIVDAGGNLDG